MMLSMFGLLLKNKYCAWLGLLVAAMAYSNLRTQNHDFKQTLSQFCLAGSAVIMAYATNPQPISVYFANQHANTNMETTDFDTASTTAAPDAFTTSL